jgi:anti-sigma factor RsiW
MNCAQVRVALPEFVYGGLTPAVQDQMEIHINGCPECRREAAALRQVRHLLTAAPAP